MKDKTILSEHHRERKRLLSGSCQEARVIYTIRRRCCELSPESTSKPLREGLLGFKDEKKKEQSSSGYSSDSCLVVATESCDLHNPVQL